jgi:eukaryotic-like serine/threonine-protein kinase
VGEILDGKYEIAREIGRGAMGVVYEALHLGLGRRVAIKTLLGQMGADGEAAARFEREAQSASAIGHPNIIDIFDLGCTQGGLRYMVMELLAGKLLDAIMRRTPQLPIPLSIHIVSQVLSGLGAAHKNGIIHRDLKPENIFVIDSDERPSFVKIVDFGISKMVGPRTTPSPTSARFAGTVAGVVLGTPLYMSPEQAIGQPLDQRTDIYSTGVVLYEMLCGRTPIEGKSYPEIMTGILKGSYPPPRSIRPEISPARCFLEARTVCRLSCHDRRSCQRATEVRPTRSCAGESRDVPRGDQRSGDLPSRARAALGG